MFKVHIRVKVPVHLALGGSLESRRCRHTQQRAVLRAHTPDRQRIEMNLMNKLTVRGKLTFAFSCLLVLMVLLGALSVMQLSRVYSKADSILSLRLSGVRDSLKMAEAASRYRSREYRLLISREGERANAMD